MTVNTFNNVLASIEFGGECLGTSPAEKQAAERKPSLFLQPQVNGDGSITLYVLHPSTLNLPPPKRKYILASRIF